MGGKSDISPIYLTRRKKMKRFFKKATGIIIEATINHNIDSLISRFTECDADGKEVKKEKPKAKPKTKKKEGK